MLHGRLTRHSWESERCCESNGHSSVSDAPISACLSTDTASRGPHDGETIAFHQEGVDLCARSGRTWVWLFRGVGIRSGAAPLRVDPLAGTSDGESGIRALTVAAVLIAGALEPGIAAAVLIGIIGVLSTLALGIDRRRRHRPASTEPAVDERPTGWPVRPDHRDETSRPVRACAPERRRSSRLPPGSRVIGYVTVSADAGSAEAERSWAAIEAKCERSTWDLLEIIHDRENQRIRQRPGLRYALERIVDRDADGLVVRDLHRLSRSIVDLGALFAWFRDAHATLVALDLGIDTSTPEGDHVAATLIALSAYEHDRIASRTRIGLAGVRGKATNGRPAVSDRPELMERIAVMRAAKMTLQAIADQLNTENVPTLRGGAKWRPSSIQATLGYQRPGPRDHLPSLKRERP
jgi:DNA invertase Pin-like site-specific DNA recombinase